MDRSKGLRRYSYDTEETSFDIHSEGVGDCERYLSHINGSSITHIDKYVTCGRVNAIELHLSSGEVSHLNVSWKDFVIRSEWYNSKEQAASNAYGIYKALHDSCRI